MQEQQPEKYNGKKKTKLTFKKKILFCVEFTWRKLEKQVLRIL